MKLARRIFTLLLVFAFSTGCFSQNKPDAKKEKRDKKERKKLGKKLSETITVKANLLITNGDGKRLDDVKIEDVKIYEDGVEQKITRFARKENALNLAFVMDNSGSLRTQLNVEQAVGKALAVGLRPLDAALVIRFVDNNKIEVVQEWTQDKKALLETMENLYVEGGQSAITDALYLAAEQILQREQADKSKRCAIVLVSDGEERDSYYELAELVALFEKTDAQIFVIALTRDLGEKGVLYENVINPKARAQKFVQNLALATGGAAYILDKKYTSDDVNAALKSIAVELSSQYIIGYTSTNQTRDGLPRKLSVQIADGANGEIRQATIRADFVVPDGKK